MNRIATMRHWVTGVLIGLLSMGQLLYAQTPTVDLTTFQSAASLPASTTLEWHNALPVSATNLITGTQTTSATPGLYYAAYNYGSACYSQPSHLMVLTNTCPATTVDLLTGVDPASIPASATVTFHSSATASAATELGSSTVTATATETTYYVAYKTFDASTNSYCYSGTSPIVVVMTVCCATPSSGGLASYAGSALCPSNNAGTISLTAQTGNVVKWQTSTNGGTSWTDLVNTTTYQNFFNAQNGQLYRAIVNGGAGCTDVYSSTVTLATNASACTSASCDNSNGQIVVNMVSGVTGNNYTKILVAVDAGGVIRGISSPNSTTITGMSLGDYTVYRVTYDNTQLPAPSLVAGQSLSAMGGACAKLSNALPYKVCRVIAPIAIADIANTTQDLPVSGNVLTNDTDPNGGPLTASLLNQPTSGTVVMNPNGSYTYTPPTGFTGTVSFCYSASNSAGLSSTACVTVNVNPAPTAGNNAPIANNDNTQTTAGQSVTIHVAANDTDPDSATGVTGQLGVPTLLGQPASGTASVVNGRVVYSPPANFTGVVSFPYQICDGGSPALCSTATVSVNVQPAPPVNTTLAPVAVDDALLTARNTSGTGAVGANDSDPNTPALPLSFTSGQPTNGTVVMSTNGSYTYTPVSDFVGADSFTYSVCNSAGQCDVATVNVTVQPTMAPPSVTIVSPATNGTVTTTPTVAGTATPGAVVTLTRPDGTTLCTTTATAGGSWSCAVTVPPGSNTLTATACNAGGCSTAVTTFTVVPPASVTINGPADGTTVASTNPPITGTATPGSSVTVLGPNGQICSTTADAGGSFSCTSLTFSPGPQSVTATDGTTSAVSNFTVAPTTPPTVAILTPTANSTITTTPTVAGTATPGSLITVQMPGPLGSPIQFCQTTATTSGAWSCSGAVLPGPLTFTATASNTNGTSIPATVSTTATTGVDICAITLPILLPLGSAITIPNYCPTPTWIYYKDIPTATSAYLAIDPNGNAWNPTSLVVDATSVANHTATAGGKTTQLANRMFHITAPGSFTVNGGVKVRLYYNPAEFAGMPANQTWFKHTAHTKSAVLADMTATSLTNAVSVTPNATGTELGVGGLQVAYVEFWNVTGFSTFGYMGSSVDTPPTVAITGPPTNSTATTTPTVSGTATPGSVVALTDPTGATLCSATATASGSWSCVVNVPPGSTTLTATACSSAGCTTTNTSFTAVPPASLTLAPTGPTTTTAPVISGTATPGSTVVITGPGPATLCTTTASVSGTFACPVTMPSGPTTLTVTACSGAGCSTATTTFTAVAPPTMAILSPADNSTVASTNPPLSGTATPLASITVSTLDGQSCVTTAAADGSWSCTSLTFAVGPQTVTAVASNSGGTSDPATSTFTVVVPSTPPTIAITGPPANGTATTSPTVSGTATPGSVVAITDPSGATLCSTTATASGSWSCVVNVPPGSTTLTATACTSAGCTSATTSFSAVSVPLDSDSDGIADVADLDDDNDGILDTAENAGLIQNGDFSDTSSWSITQNGTASAGTASIVGGILWMSADVSSAGANYVITQPLTGCWATNKSVSMDVSWIDGGAVPSRLQVKIGGVVYAEMLTSATSAASFSYTNGASGNLSSLNASPFSVSSGILTVNSYGHWVVNLPANAAAGPLTFVFEPTNIGGNDDIVIDNVVPSLKDTDCDGIANSLDLDSDGDGCLDAIEGGAAFTTTNLSGSVLAGAVSSATATYGVPVTAGAGQTIGSSQISAINGCTDTDGDGIADIDDLDDDNDGILDSAENASLTQNGNFSSTSSWTINQTGTTSAGSAAITGGQLAISTDLSTAGNVTVSQPMVGCWASGKRVSLDTRWVDGGAAGASLKVQVGSTVYGEMITSATNMASFSYTNGASGNLTSLAQGTGLTNWVVYLPNSAATGTLNLVFTPLGTGGADDVYIDNVVTGAQDTDCDGLANSLDLDSDGDGCPDAVEGTGGFTLTQLVSSTMAGGNSGSSFTGSSNSQVKLNLGTTVDANGVPTLATAAGQAVGNSQNGAVLSACAPAIAILSPATNATVTTSPTVSGTATPGSVVALTDPSGATLCSATATASGSWSCVVNVPPGSTTLTATVCNAVGCATATTSFTAVPPTSLTVAPTGPSTTTAPVISGTATPGSTVVITGPGPATLCTTTASASGTFACPVTMPSGPTTLTVTACSGAGCSTATTSFTAVAPPTIAILSPANNTTVGSTNPPISGTATPLASVTVAGPDSQSCVTTAAADGSWTCTSLTFTTGPQTVTALASNSGGTSTPAVDNFTVVGPPSLTVTGPVNTTTSPLPTIVGTATPGSVITITDPLNQTICSTTASASGTFTCGPISGLPVGPNTLTVTATGPGGSTSQPVTFTTVTVPTVAIDSPVDGTTATTTPTVLGTATPLASVTVLGPNSQSCVTTAAADGSFTCTSLTFAAGPASITAIASNAAGTSTPAVSDFTAVAPTSPPSLTVVPTGPTTTTAPVISGTATPGAQVVITSPGPTTLCTATADASGVFSCTVNVPAGPNTLTVTACTTGGCSTTTASFTAVAPPTIAIVSPADNTTQPAATNSVSGTATPSATVVVATAGGNFTTTADPTTGTYSVTGLTFPSGPNTVTATATNVGGTATTASTFTIVGPPSLTVSSPVNVSTTTTPTIAGTASPGSQIVITGPGPATLCTTTASVSSTFACALTTPLPTGPNTLTVTATGPGGSTSVPVTFTTVPPASLTVAPTGPTTTTAPVISGTTTPGAQVVITSPGPTTLCTATADASGVFSCTMNVPAGPNTLTITACTTGGCSTTTASFTAVAPPTMAILSPADNSTVASTNPPLSGTATPLASITVSTLDGQSCVTTAAADGSWSCTSLTFAVGPQTVTAVASNSGGTSDPATSTFTVVSPSTPPTVAITGPPANGTATTSPTVSGTATPGSVVALTDPSGVTLCTTTATAGGSWSCTVNVSPGSTTLTATACTSVGCATATTSFTAVGALQPPVTTPDIANTTPNTPVSGNVLTNDVDPEGGPLTASLLGQPTSGTVTLSPNGSYIYTPPTGFTGTTSFCYSVSNTAGLSSSACVTVNVNPVPTIGNDAPIANNDNTQTTAGMSVTVNVAANDTDPDGTTGVNGQLGVPTLLGQPASGTATVVNGQVVYTPPANFTGVVRFPYSICDGGSPALCATAMVSVNVLPTAPVGTTLAPVALDDALLTAKSTSATGTVAANDSDPNAPALPLSFTSGQPTNGTVVMSTNGSYTYTPALGYVGPDSFTYTVCNTAGQCDVATVSVDVQPLPNNPPLAQPDFKNVIVGIPATGNVLTNDKDAEGTPLTAQIVGTPPAGFTLSPDGSGSYTYTAPVGTTAPVTVPIQVCDGATPPSCVTTTLTLIPVPASTPANDGPIANPDSPRTTAGVPVTANILANDMDPEGNPLSNPTIVTQPTHGTAVVNPNGTVSYTPTAGYTGTDQLTYSVCDGGTPPACATTTVTLTVDPTPPVGTTNTAPIAQDDALLTQQGVSATGTVAANDSDPQNQTLAFAKLTNPANGTVVFNLDGTYTYSPAPGFVGSDQFTYQVCDNANPALCATATAHLTVQPVVIESPKATPDIANMSPNVPVSGNVLTNDTDPQGLPLTASLLGQPTSGTVTMDPDGSYTYTPPTNFTGTISFCYSVSNTAGLSSSACVTMNVNPAPSPALNDAPVANNDNTQTTAGTPVVVAVLANDTDPDTATSLNGQFSNPVIVFQPSVGTAVVNANGTVTFTPPANFTGVVSFPYRVCDQATPASCATAVVNVDVQPTPPVGTTLAPVAVDDALLTQANTSKTATVATNDSDPAGLSLTYTAGMASYGSVVMAPTGSYTYTPLSDFKGPDSFTYAVCNTAGKCDVATVSVLVQQPATANESPVVTPDVNTFIPGIPTAGNVLTNDKDPEGTPLTAQVVGTPPAGFTLSLDGSYTYTSPTSQTAPVTVPIQVCDTGTSPTCTTTLLTLTPTPNPTLANDGPVALNDATRTTAGVSTTVNVLGNDKDPESLPLSNPTIVSVPTNGTASVNPDGTITYTPAGSFTGVDQLTYQVCDTGTPVACATAVVTFAVDPTPPVGVTNVAPVAIDDQLLTTKGVSATGTVATNDSDPNVGQTLTFTRLSNPANGTVVFSSTGSYSFVPAAGFVGTDHFMYQVCDGGSPVLCTTATVYITVNGPVNEPPKVQPDFADVVPGIPTTGNVLTNDKDPEGTPLTAQVVGPPPAGFTMSPNGSYTYTAPVGTTAPVTVPVQVCDNGTPPACSTTTLTLVPVPVSNPTTNDTPIANPDTPKTTDGVPVVVAVLANDVDPEGQPLSNPTIATQPTHGTAVVNPNGTVSYTPTAGYTGTDQLTYSVCDGGTPPACATALVTFTIDPTPPVSQTNLPPVAIDDALLTQQGVSATGTVAANDTDPNVGQTLTFTKLTNPVNGTVVFSLTGSYTWTPSPTFVGTDQFAYQVCDNATPTLCATATAHLTVPPVASQPPVLTPDIANTNPNAPVTGNVLTNDTDPQGLPLTASLLTPPGVGTVVISPTGSYTYNPPTNFTGVATFCYSASNTAGQSGSVCVTVNVNPVPSAVDNNAPIANNDNTQTTMGVPVTIVALANDTDPDNSTSVNGQLNNPTVVTQPVVGTAAVNANGSITYTPPANFTGVVSFPYQICDKATPALCATALVTVNVQPTPPAGTTLAPVAIDDALLAQIDTPKSGTVGTNDSDPAGLPLTFNTGQPNSGTVVMSPTGSYTYTPAPGYTGPASFTYSVCNSAGKCDVATVSVDVQRLLRPGSVSVPVRVFLQGALTRPGLITTSIMRDDLRRKGLIPTTEPYTAMGYVHVGGGSSLSIANPSAVFSVTGANAIIDWVMVELRSTTAPYAVLATMPGLVQADGDVVQTDGVSTIAFSQSALGATAYQVSVHHRNHLGVMTANPISLTGTVAVVDFTSASTPIYQLPSADPKTQTAPLALERGLLALWAGNTNGDQSVILQGPNNDVDPVFFDVVDYAPNTAGLTNYIRSDVYLNSDVDMNGQVIFQGEDNEVDILFFEIMLHPGNDVGQFINYIIWQQLP